MSEFLSIQPEDQVPGIDYTGIESELGAEAARLLLKRIASSPAANERLSELVDTGSVETALHAENLLRKAGISLSYSTPGGDGSGGWQQLPESA